MPTYARRRSPFGRCYAQALRRHSSFAKKPIKLSHLRGDALEKVDAHPKTPTEVVLGKYRIFIEIHPHQPIVAFDSFPPQLVSTKNRATSLRFFVGAPSQ
jgi:hypothetical protein